MKKGFFALFVLGLLLVNLFSFVSGAVESDPSSGPNFLATEISPLLTTQEDTSSNQGFLDTLKNAINYFSAEEREKIVDRRTEMVMGGGSTFHLGEMSPLGFHFYFFVF